MGSQNSLKHYFILFPDMNEESSGFLVKELIGKEQLISVINFKKESMSTQNPVPPKKGGTYSSTWN